MGPQLLGSIGLVCAWITIFSLLSDVKRLKDRVQKLEAEREHAE
jgi:hypothetical protein